MSPSTPQPAFARLLRAAVSASDLTLADLAARLAEAGHPVSRSSLSAWQSGHTVPARRDALAALPRIEQQLGLEPGVLTSALPSSAAPEGSLLQPEVRPLWARSAATRQLLAQLDTRADDPTQPERLSLRFRVHVDDQGRQEAMHFSIMLRGGAATADRLVPVVRFEQLPSLPLIPLLFGATLGRMRARPSLGMVAFELLLDEPLAPREETLVEYLLPLPVPTRTQWIRTEIAAGLREVTLQAVFSGGCTPAQVRMTSQTGSTGALRSQVLDGADNSYQSVVLDPDPGGYGMEWSWPA